MKNLIKNSLLLLIVMLIVVEVISAARFGNWAESLLIFQLYSVSLLLLTTQLLTKHIKSNWYLFDLCVEYFVVLIIVGGSGLLYHWFTLDILWHVPCYVTPVYIVSYFLDLVRTRKDVAIINERLKLRNSHLRKEQSNDTTSHSN